MSYWHRNSKITLQKTVAHFRTITYHKYLVAQGCFKVGLYRQGLIHDLSKYSPTEFWVGARYYQGDRSPNNAEREDIGYSTSWLHHKGRNKHHYEYWSDYVNPHDTAGLPPNIRRQAESGGIVWVKMPGRYVVEMLMDRIAASKVYRKEQYTDQDPLRYYLSGSTSRFMHPETAALLEKLLRMLAEKGEDATFAYIRAHLYKRSLFR